VEDLELPVLAGNLSFQQDAADRIANIRAAVAQGSGEVVRRHAGGVDLEGGGGVLAGRWRGTS